MEQMFTKTDVQKMIAAAVDYTFNLTDHTFHSEFADPKQAARVEDLKLRCVETVMAEFDRAQPDEAEADDQQTQRDADDAQFYETAGLL